MKSPFILTRAILFVGIALSKFCAADPASQQSPVDLVHIAPYVQGNAPTTSIGSTPITVSPAEAPIHAAVAAKAITTGQTSFHVGPEDIDLRDALERWLKPQGWQLAWTIQDSMPIGYEATFSGKDLKDVLWQVMEATNQMSTPSRVCRHTPNQVIRVVGRHVNCKE